MKEVIRINKIIIRFLTIIAIITVFVSVFFIPINDTKFINFVETGELLWPAPGYYRINSYFGRRNAPTAGASSYHKGIDIGAPQNSPYVAVTNGTVTFADFFGGGGYTLTITDENKENGEIKYSYCHSSPNFIVSVGEKVYKGQIIGYVGPKNVYGVKRQPIF